MKIYTSYVSKDNLNKFISLGFLPIFILRNIRNSKLLSSYADTCIHLRELSPSTELFHQFKSGEIDVEEYHYQYLLELLDRHISTLDIYKRLEFLCSLCNAPGVVLLGYEEDKNLCHRKALSEFLSWLWRTEINEWVD